MPTGNDAALKALAEATAATIQATMQRWWIDSAHPRLLHIAAERTFVGARPIAVHFTVRLHPTQIAAAGPVRMQVGASVEPPPVAKRKTPAKSMARAPARKPKRQVRAKAASQPAKKRKFPVRLGSSTHASRPKKRVQQSGQRVKRQTAPKRTSKRVQQSRQRVKRQAAPSRTSGRKARRSS
jgi:hypothetical protein